MSTPGETAAAAPRHGATSDVGLVRELNEDSLLVAPPLFVVADGMGGHDGGEVASALAVEALGAAVPGHDAPAADPQAVAEAVDAALRAAQERIGAFDAEQRAAGAARFSSGTTVVAATLTVHEGGPAWLVSNLGDSRAYGFDGRVLSRLSVDHSLVQELLDAGTISPDEAREHPERHVITRALGAAGPVAADHVVVPVALAPRLLLCSDGISDLLDDAAIAETLAAHPDPQAAADALVAAALDAGGIDNATAVVVDAAGTDLPADLPADPPTDPPTRPFTAPLDLTGQDG